MSAPATTISVPPNGHLSQDDLPTTTDKTLDEKNAYSNTASISEGCLGDVVVDSELLSAEYENSFYETCKAWPYAMLWSCLISLAAFLVSYTGAILGQFFAIPAFQAEYGYQYSPGLYVIQASWQTGITATGFIGQILGSMFVVIPMGRYGRKKPLAAGLVMTILFTLIQYFSKSLQVLLVGTLLVNFAIGFFSVTSLTYASEVAPFKMRAFLTNFINVGFLGGPLISLVVANGLAVEVSGHAYKYGFVFQFALPALILIPLPFAPESPYWLIRRGDFSKAEKSLERLARNTTDSKSMFTQISATISTETQYEATSTFINCFQGIDRRRTLIAMIMFGTIPFTGSFFNGYSSYFMILAGIDVQTAFNFSVGNAAAPIIGYLIGVVLLVYIGRRRLYLFGLALSAAPMLIIGILEYAPDYSARINTYVWVQAAMLVVNSFAYGCFTSPIPTIVICEVSSSRLREKTIALANASQYVLTLALTPLVPYLINPDEANMHGKIGFIFGATTLALLVWASFFLPETGLPFATLDRLFKAKTPTRKFAAKGETDHVA